MILAVLGDLVWGLVGGAAGGVQPAFCLKAELCSFGFLVLVTRPYLCTGRGEKWNLKIE